MTAAINKYDILLTSGKRNTIYLEQNHIVTLTAVVEKLKDNNLNIFKYIKQPIRRKKGS